jgi:hypothetical protein
MKKAAETSCKTLFLRNLRLSLFQKLHAGLRYRGEAGFVLRILCLISLTTGFASASLKAESPSSPVRFLASFADGSRGAGPTLPAWPVAELDVRRDGKGIFAAGNPLRMMRDQEAALEGQAPLVMLANGDCVNGLAVGLVTGPEGPRLKLRLVSPLSSDAGEHVLVRPDQVRRITSTVVSHNLEPAPGTVWLTDWRKLSARSLRLGDSGLAILTDKGLVEVPYDRIADAVFPNVDLTAAVLEDRRFANPALVGAISRFTLRGGATLTSGRVDREAELVTRKNGKQGLPHVTYRIQPVWSSQAILVPEEEIAWCSYRAANEVPLALLPMEILANRGLLGPAKPCRRNEGATGECLLAGGGRESDLGFSTHSYSELAVTLPPGASSLSLSVAMDHASGKGGCVRCRIFANRVGGKELWKSRVFRGNEAAKETGKLDVESVEQVVLVTEYAHDDRPPGADPLDIRDDVLWLNPLLKMAVK